MFEKLITQLKRAIPENMAIAIQELEPNQERNETHIMCEWKTSEVKNAVDITRELTKLLPKDVTPKLIKDDADQSHFVLYLTDLEKHKDHQINEATNSQVKMNLRVLIGKDKNNLEMSNITAQQNQQKCFKQLVRMLPDYVIREQWGESGQQDHLKYKVCEVQYDHSSNKVIFTWDRFPNGMFFMQSFYDKIDERCADCCVLDDESDRYKIKLEVSIKSNLEALLLNDTKWDAILVDLQEKIATGMGLMDGVANALGKLSLDDGDQIEIRVSNSQALVPVRATSSEKPSQCSIIM